MRAARRPAWAARPTCSGLVIDPKFATTPPASDAAMATAWLVSFASRRRSDADAAAAWVRYLETGALTPGQLGAGSAETATELAERLKGK